MTATLGSFPVFRALDAGGAPLVGGLLYSYGAGTLVPLATYVDQAGVTTNANPVVLDSTGSANVWFGASAYKLVMKDSGGSTLWTVDNYQPESAAATLRSDLASTASTALGDALVGVKSTLTGGAATNQHIVNQESVSIFRFMTPAQWATWNGAQTTTDVTTYLQAALDAVVDGGSVYIPTGYYLFSTVSTTKAVRLIGDGFTNKLQALFGAAAWSTASNFGGSVLISTATSGNSISIGLASVNNTLQLKDFMLVGAGSGTATGIQLLRSVGNDVSNVLVCNSSRGWFMDQCQDGLYSKIASKGCKSGIELGGIITSGQTVLINPEVQSFDTVGIKIDIASMVMIYGGLIQDGRGGYGMILTATTSSKNLIQGVWFENADVGGAHPTGAIAIYSARNKVSGCYFGDPFDTILVSGANADRNIISDNHFGSINTAITVAAGATNTYIFNSEPVSGGTISDAGSNTIRVSHDSGAVSQTIGNTSFSGTVSTGGLATAAGTDTKLVRKSTGLADAAYTAIAYVNIPNSAIAANLKIRILGSLGAGGAVGANEASATLECDVVITRTSGLTCVVAQSASYGTSTAAVAGAATCAVAVDASLIAGSATAVQTLTIRASITRGSGSSTNHTATYSIECLNANAGGVLVY